MLSYRKGRNALGEGKAYVHTVDDGQIFLCYFGMYSIGM